MATASKSLQTFEAWRAASAERFAKLETIAAEFRAIADRHKKNLAKRALAAKPMVDESDTKARNVVTAFDGLAA